MAPRQHLGSAESEHALVRYSHIFSAAVREVLDVGLLREAGGDGLTPRQLDLLRFIALARHHVDDVARFLDISAPAATKTLDKLERRGLVLRKPCDDGDRRLTYVACSERGVAVLARQRTLEQQRIDDVATAFSDDELAELTFLLQRYSLALISSTPERDVPCLRCAGWPDANCPLQLIHSRCPYQERGDQ